MGGWGFKENETDTFISVDIELCRGAINCFVYDYGRWKGERAEIHFPVILVRFSKHLCTTYVS